MPILCQQLDFLSSRPGIKCLKRKAGFLKKPQLMGSSHPYKYYDSRREGDAEKHALSWA